MTSDRTTQTDGSDPGATIEADPGAVAWRRPGAVASVVEVSDFELRTELQDRGLVGTGGMAVVRRVFDRVLDRMVAAKILRPGMSPAARARFAQEARIMGQLEHPNIIPVHGFAGDRFTMKLVHGESLAEHLEAGDGPPRHQLLADLVRQLLKVCDALAFAHSRGVVHRDIKPENIMLGRFGEVYLVDWGIALVLGSEETREPPTVVGTPAFMSPEAARGELGTIDARSDVFGLGAVLYELLTGDPPYDGADAQEVLREALRCEITPPHAVAGAQHQPAMLCDIAMKAMARSPADRYQGIDAMAAALEAFLRSGAWFARRRVSAGTEIVREGEPGREAFIVEHGECDVFRGEGETREHIRAISPGEAFGELAPIAGGSRTATVVARQDVSLLVIDDRVLEQQFPGGSWPRHFFDSLAARILQNDRERAAEGARDAAESCD